MNVTDLAVFAAIFAVVWCVWRWLGPHLPAITRSRRRALDLVTPILALAVLVFVPAGRELAGVFLRQAGMLSLLAVSLLTSLASAVVTVELFRAVVRGAAWKDRTHFAVVGILWACLLLVQAGFLVIVRGRLCNVVAPV